MSTLDFQVRRATVEDLPVLSPLWESMNLGSLGLDRRLTEFQVATGPDGAIVGAIGFQMAGKQALLHSEAFTDFGVADPVRTLLWERIQILAANHGIVRVWTRESAPFWSRNVFSRPDSEALSKLPPAWNEKTGGLLTLKLREDVEEMLSLDKEFALFAESERARSETALRQAKVLKTIATVTAIILGIAVLIASIFLILKKNPPPVP